MISFIDYIMIDMNYFMIRCELINIKCLYPLSILNPRPVICTDSTLLFVLKSGLLSQRWVLPPLNYSRKNNACKMLDNECNKIN